MPQVETIKKLISKVRKKRDWSNEVLAAQLRVCGVECSTSSIYNWSRGNDPHPNTARVLRPELTRLLR